MLQAALCGTAWDPRDGRHVPFVFYLVPAGREGQGRSAETALSRIYARGVLASVAGCRLFSTPSRGTTPQNAATWRMCSASSTALTAPFGAGCSDSRSLGAVDRRLAGATSSSPLTRGSPRRSTPTSSSPADPISEYPNDSRSEIGRSSFSRSLDLSSSAGVPTTSSSPPTAESLARPTTRSSTEQQSRERERNTASWTDLSWSRCSRRTASLTTRDCERAVRQHRRPAGPEHGRASNDPTTRWTLDRKTRPEGETRLSGPARRVDHAGPRQSATAGSGQRRGVPSPNGPVAGRCRIGWAAGARSARRPSDNPPGAATPLLTPSVRQRRPCAGLWSPGSSATAR
jgi:hypothetical protein